MAELSLPLTDRGRKYGYITWPKARAAEVRGLLGEEDTLTLVLPTGREKRGKADWKYNRLSVGPSSTRSLPPSIQSIRLVRSAPGQIEVIFA